MERRNNKVYESKRTSEVTAEHSGATDDGDVAKKAADGGDLPLSLSLCGSAAHGKERTESRFNKKERSDAMEDDEDIPANPYQLVLCVAKCWC